MADLTFMSGKTKTGRGYLANKESCKIATFEKGYQSIQFLVKDKLTKSGIRIVGSLDTKGNILISMSQAEGLSQPKNWSLKEYNLNDKDEHESLVLDVGETLDNIIVEEV